MVKGIRGVGMFSALVWVIGSFGSAFAQGDAGDATESQDAAAEPRPEKGEGKKTRGARTATGNENKKRRGDRKSAAVAVPAVPGRLNEAFTFALGGGCDYSSTVRGSVKTAKTPNGEEPRFVPTLTINAWISCENNTELRVTDNSLREIPMTRAELEQAIELRATLLAESSATRCAYVPDFTLGENRLSGLGVFYLCPTGPNGAPTESDQQEDAMRSLPLDPAASVGRATPEVRPAADTHGAERGSRERSPSDEPR